MTATSFAAPAPVARRMRAYFAPVNRVTQTPVLFDPSQSGSFNLDAPPSPWIDLGWIQNFTRKPTRQEHSYPHRHSRFAIGTDARHRSRRN